MALAAQKGRETHFLEAVAHLMENPDSVKWPLDDPLLCLLIGFMCKHAQLWVEKASEKRDYDRSGDEADQADWGKTEPGKGPTILIIFLVRSSSSIRTLSYLITQFEQAECSKDGKTALLKLRIDLAISQKDLAKLSKRITRLRHDSD